MRYYLTSLLLIAAITACKPQKDNSSNVKDKSSSQQTEQEDIIILPGNEFGSQDQTQQKHTEMNKTIRVHYGESFQYHEYRVGLQDGRWLEEIAGLVTRIFNLNADLQLTTDDCEEKNAFYSPSEKKITFCYEMMHWIWELFRYAPGTYLSKEEVWEQTMNTVLVIMMHEFGHAFIDIFDPPMTGKEEDVADQISSLFFLGFKDREAAGVVLSAAAFWLLDSVVGSSEYPVYWGRHSLNEQRFYNLSCWVYGSDPHYYRTAISEDHLPESRKSGLLPN